MADPLIRELLDHRKIEFLVLDRSCKIQRVSRGVARLADIAEDVKVGREVFFSFPELIGAEDDLNLILSGVKRTWHVKGVQRHHPDSDPHYVDVDITAHRSPDETIDGLVLIVQDVTERMKLEQRLSQHSNESTLLLEAIASSKSHLDNIVNSLFEILLVTASDGTIELVNETTQSLLGYHRIELLDQHISRIIDQAELLPGPDQSPPHLMDSSAHFEILCKHKNGEFIPLSFTCTGLRSEHDILEGIVYLGRDRREEYRAKKEVNELKSANIYLQEEIKSTHNFEEIVGDSPAMKTVFNQVEQVATTDSTVLLMGETGTGKELIARAIHNLSNRKQKVLVKVNCAALPSGLVESELFGHEKGAFTGATSRKSGRFDLAHGGTMLLDEIGEIPLDTQVKLLRVLQEREFEPVGGTRTHKVDVRVITATNKDLQEAVRQGAFRSDLFYRLNVFPISIPPLREREGDIHLLTSYFVKKFSTRMNKRIESVSKKVMDALLRYSWPGNVRELASVIERGVILCEGTAIKNVDARIAHPIETKPRRVLTLDQVQRQHILDVLNMCGGRIEGDDGASTRLGLHPSTLRSRMRKLGIKRLGTRFR